MGEPVVEVKSEEAVPESSPSKKVKLEPTDAAEGAPESKKLKLEDEAEVLAAQEGNGSAPNGGNFKTAEEKGEPDLDEKIVHQIEYYFGNLNLPKDKFLQEQIKLDDGWVPLEVMIRFQRLARLSKNPSTIANALKTGSMLMEVSEDGSKLRRSPSKPLPTMNEEWQKLVNERTVYCKGFPLTETNISAYIEFFKPYGPVEHINLRKYLDRATKKLIYKGSAYVTFDTKELVDKFLALESVEFAGEKLIRMTHAAHTEEKKKEKDERWGKKVKKEGTAEDKDKGKPKKEFPKGCIIKISDVVESSREIIKESLTSLGADVAFIQYSKGDADALVRLDSKEDGAAAQFLTKLGENVEKVKIGEEEKTISIVDGEEEEAFLLKSRESFERNQKGHRKGNKHHKGGHRGGFRGQKRGRSPKQESA